MHYRKGFSFALRVASLTALAALAAGAEAEAEAGAKA